MYNLTNLTSATGVSGLITFANSVTNSLLSGILVMVIFFVLLMALKRYEFVKALASSSFACFIISMLMVYAGMLNFVFLLGFLSLTALTVFYMYVVGD